MMAFADHTIRPMLPIPTLATLRAAANLVVYLPVATSSPMVTGSMAYRRSGRENLVGRSRVSAVRTLRP